MTGIYKAEHNNLTGYVKAHNQASADVQMKWVEENKTCFCRSCVEDLAKDYLTYIAASSASHTMTQVLPGGVHAIY